MGGRGPRTSSCLSRTQAFARLRRLPALQGAGRLQAACLPEAKGSDMQELFFFSLIQYAAKSRKIAPINVFKLFQEQHVCTSFNTRAMALISNKNVS